MKKNNKLMILITLVCLCPIVLSLFMYNKLPDRIAIHFDAAGNPNGYAPKAFAIFGLPVIMAIVNLFGIFVLNNDPKKANSSEILKLVGIWTAPILSVILTPVTLFKSMGVNIPINLIIIPLVGIIFMICGNYFPKCKQNYTVGIKLPWTLNNEDNWNKTHHMAGYLWIIGGFIITLSAFLNSYTSFIIMMVVLVIMILIPSIYSYLLFRKNHN